MNLLSLDNIGSDCLGLGNMGKGHGQYGKVSAWVLTIWESEFLGLGNGKVSTWAWTIWENECLGLDNGKVGSGARQWESECFDLNNLGKRVLESEQFRN